MNWISVNDRLPDHTNCVLTYDGQNTSIEAYIDGQWGMRQIYRRLVDGVVPVTHWMPLPAAPESHFDMNPHPETHQPPEAFD